MNKVYNTKPMYIIILVIVLVVFTVADSNYTKYDLVRNRTKFRYDVSENFSKNKKRL